MKPYFQDDAVTIYHGDCREVLPQLSGVDLVLTDPPYGVRRDQPWDDLEPSELAGFTMGWLSLVRPISARLISFFSGAHIQLLQTLCCLLYPAQRLMIWHKPDGSQYAGSSHDGLWYSYEAILYCHEGFDRPKALYVAAMLREARESKGLSRGAIDMLVRGKKTGLCFRWEEAACIPTPEQAEILSSALKLNGEFHAVLNAARTQAESASGTDVLSFRTVTGSVHPTEKPPGLIKTLLQRMTGEAGLILDPFMGSGTTLRAAKDLGRRAIGIEIEERYCEVAAKRMAQGVLL